MLTMLRCQGIALWMKDAEDGADILSAVQKLEVEHRVIATFGVLKW